MKKMNVFFALMLGAVVSFSSCSDDDELTPEQQEAKDKKELIAEITVNYNMVTAKEWAFKEFISSDDMIAASKTEDGAVALTKIKRREQAKNFNLAMSFAADGDLFKPSVAVAEEGLDAKLLEYQAAISGIELDFLLDTKEFYLAEIRRIMAAPFAADDLTRDDITDDETGLVIFKIGMRDFSGLSYDDVVLSQKMLIAGNTDKIYFNQDGTLTVEVTDEQYGISKLILEEVK